MSKKRHDCKKSEVGESVPGNVSGEFMSIGEWFSRLPGEYRDSALLQVKDSKRSVRVNSMSQALMQGLYWEKTVEGGDYWSGLYKSYENAEGNGKFIHPSGERTIAWWYETLPAVYRDMALKELDVSLRGSTVESLSEALMQGFTWGKSAQGHVFWAEVRRLAYYYRELPADPRDVDGFAGGLPEGFEVPGRRSFWDRFIAYFDFIGR